MGGDVTELIVFSNNKVVFNLSIDMGGEDITRELSNQFKIPGNVAEDLKERYGTIHEGDLNIDEKVTVDVESRRIAIERSSMNYAINSKMKGLFSSIRSGLEKSGYYERIPAGIVMTGAPLLMSGILETAEKEFKLPVRMGTNSDVKGDGNITSNPLYTTGIGLVKYAVNKNKKTTPNYQKHENILSRAAFRIKEILTDYF